LQQREELKPLCFEEQEMGGKRKGAPCKAGRGPHWGKGPHPKISSEEATGIPSAVNRKKMDSGRVHGESERGRPATEGRNIILSKNEVGARPYTDRGTSESAISRKEKGASNGGGGKHGPGKREKQNRKGPHSKRKRCTKPKPSRTSGSPLVGGGREGRTEGRVTPEEGVISKKTTTMKSVVTWVEGGQNSKVLERKWQ